MNKFFKEYRNKEILAGIFFVSVLAIVLIPLFMVAPYNFQSADDWSFGANGYHILKNGGSVFDVFIGAFRVTWDAYISWDGAYSSIFLSAFEPAIFGEECYVVVPYIMIGSLIIFEVLAILITVRTVTDEGKLFFSVLPIILPSIILQILYCPSTVESFYWYMGAVAYTFPHALSFTFIALFIYLMNYKGAKIKFTVLYMLEIFITWFIGGSNFIVRIYVTLTLFVLTFFMTLKNRTVLKRALPVMFLTLFWTLLSIFAPGNMVRFDSSFAAQSENPIFTICKSLYSTGNMIVSWTNIKVILMLFIILPFVLMLVRRMKFEFGMPGLYTFFSFGLFATQLTAVIQVKSSFGARMVALYYYSYHVFIVSNFVYWIGWAYNRFIKDKKANEVILGFINKWILCYTAIFAAMLFGLILIVDKKEISSYTAYRDYKQGWAKQYADEWKERFEILHDDSIKDVVFKPLSVMPYSFAYTDLQTDDGYIWLNYVCAEYYEKDSIIVEK